MSVAAIRFVEPGVAQFAPADLPQTPGQGQVLLHTETTLISPGTELAVLSGQESWAPLPYLPGYGAVGKVLEVGPGVKDVKPGDRIFTHSRHAARDLSANVHIIVPDSLPPEDAVFARIGQIGMTALRITDATPGDVVVVIGLGLVGNLAAQLFALAGCDVIAIDPSEARRARAARCGLPHALPPAPQQQQLAHIRRLTDGRLPVTIVEATGVPAVAMQAAGLAGPLGELILLGSPRGQHAADVTPLLNQVHLWNQGCLTIKGAHEWRLPVRADSTGRVRHSMEGNLQCLMRWLAQGRLHVAPLRTHILPPAKAQSAYDGLKSDPEIYQGVVFDCRGD